MNNADWTNWQDGWHFLSSPVSSEMISPAFTTDPYDFYCWYEPANQWVNYKNTTTPPAWNTATGSTNFILGKGYMAAYDDSGVKLFTGTMNVGNVAVSGLTITGSGLNRSWHLLGNPFGSALTWDASASWSLTNIAGVAKIWNEANQSYSDLTSSPSIVIPATNGFDLMYDGEFLAGYAPAFYSIVTGMKLSTNSLPSLANSTEILFGFVKSGGANYRIEAKCVESLPEKAYLHDLKTGTITDLTQNPVYSFTSSTGDNPDRFLLKFGNVGMVGHEVNNLRVWYSQEKLFLSNTAGDALVEIYDMAGRQVFQCNTCGNPVQLNLVAGIYFARVTSKQQVKTVKFFIGQ
ncbi:MAG: T9SS type A sorting domain-containing protein [Bacteroidales bacterium]|nr:T9SS type A sorting domain-containing protein [Bacteroidales bacterium]